MNSNKPLTLDNQTSICIPPDVRDWRLEQVQISVRLDGVLRRLGYSRLGDLHGISWKRIERTKNCGRKTIAELRTLVAELESGQITGQADQTVGSQPPVPTPIFIPQNARGWSLAHLPVSVRLTGVLETLGCHLLGDLHGLFFREVIKTKNCGRNTISELETLISRVQAGEFDLAMSPGQELDLTCLVRSLNDSIGRLQPRAREMLLLRLGGHGNEPMTLEQVGVKSGLTRERVRQIVKKVTGQLQLGSELRGNQWLGKLTEKCLIAVCPLTPELLTHWLGAEAAVCRFPASFYIRLLGELSPPIPAWPERQQRHAMLSERSRQIVRYLRERLQSQVVSVPLREAFEELKTAGKLTSLQPGEFLKALQHDESVKVEFVTPDQPTVRPSRLRTREWAYLVLSQAESPLTSEEIIERARQMLGDDFDPITPFSLKNYLKRETGFYRRYTFGLRKHFRLPDQLLQQIQADFYQLLCEEARPVSTSEVINQEKFEWATLMDAGEVAQALREDPRFTDLGSFLFALTARGGEEQEHVKDLIPTPEI